MSNSAKDSSGYNDLYEAISASRKTVPCIFLQCLHPHPAKPFSTASGIFSRPNFESNQCQPSAAPAPVSAPPGHPGWQNGSQQEHLTPGLGRATVPTGTNVMAARPLYQVPAPPRSNGYPPPTIGQASHTQQQLNTLFSDANTRRINPAATVVHPHRSGYPGPQNQISWSHNHFNSGRDVPDQQGPRGLVPADPAYMGLINPSTAENRRQVPGWRVVDPGPTPRPHNRRHYRPRSNTSHT